jgi:transposase
MTAHSDATRRRALQLYKKGLFLRDIADVVGAHVTTIEAWKKVWGVARKTKHPRYHPEKTIRAAMTAYVKGESCDSIGARLGVARATVISWATRRRVERKTKPDTHKTNTATRRRAVKLYAAGKSGNWLGDTFGVSPDTIYRWCRLAGVPVRPREPQPQLDDERVLATHRQWKSVRITAEILGISRTGVQRSLRRSRATTATEQKAAA